MGIVQSLSIHVGAAADLAAIKRSDPQAWGRLVALLQQLKSDPELVYKLLDHKFEEKHGIKFQVSKYLKFWNDGYDIWRIKALRAGPELAYRIIYAYDATGPRFCILAVAERSFNYDPTHAITKRIRTSYEELGLPIH